MAAWIEERKRMMEARRKARRENPTPVTTYFLDAWWENRDEAPLLREARALLALWGNMPIELHGEELLCGTLSVREPVGFQYGSATWIDREAAEAYVSAGHDRAALSEKLAGVEARRYHPGEATIFTEVQNRSIQAYAATSTWFGGHMVLDYEKILAIGLDGYAREIDGHANDDFYEALRTMLAAVQTYILRYADMARPDMALALRRIAHEPPASFREGLQLVWILHLLNGADSFGRFDDYLLPLFAADRASGALGEEEAYRLLVEFWVKIEEADAIQNMTIGGVNTRGEAQYTDLTALCLRATREVGYKGPNLCLRVAKDMPEAIWRAALSCLGTGLGLPALYRDEAYVEMLARAGYPPEVARGYCLAGCSQVMLPGMCNFVNDIGIYNIAKVMELTLRNGCDPLTNAQVGPASGALGDFPTFEALMAAFYANNRYFIELEAQINDRDTVYRREREGYAMRTLFMRDCIERGKSVFAGGARYNNIELEILGLTNAADSLYAVKRAVFDEKRFTADELLRLLETDFADNEAARLYLRNRVTKFGNDQAECDRLREEISRETYRLFNERASVLGGVYVPGEVIFVAHEPAGRAIGATPDGRHAYTVLADSMGASQGLDTNGPTALLRSVAKVGAADYLLTTAVLNIRFAAGVWNADHAKMRALIESFFAQGGTQLQINVCDAAELREALRDPESHRSLVVRVGGYSDYFVNLSPALQQEILLRTEQAV